MIHHQTHVYSCDVPFDLIDAAGVLHHPNYLILCERARTQSLTDAGCAFAELWAEQVTFVLRSHMAEYFKPIRMGQLLYILTHTIQATASTLEVKQRISLKKPERESSSPFFPGVAEVETQDLAYQVQMRLVCLDLKRFKPCRLPEKLKKTLQLSYTRYKSPRMDPKMPHL